MHATRANRLILAGCDISMKLAQLVLGPAGVGKSTYCEVLSEHCRDIGRPTNIINLDPAAEHFYYAVSADIRELITITDATETMNLGPNGGLVYCMEYFEQNLYDFLNEALEGYTDDDYVLFDCPGQTELYTHLSVFQSMVEYLVNDGWTVCAVYCLDASFMSDVSKFVGGCFQALSVMLLLSIPHLNVLTKMDLCPNKEAIEGFMEFDRGELESLLHKSTGHAFSRLNSAVAGLVEDFNLVNFLPLDITDNESVHEVLMSMDRATQYGDDIDFRTRDFGFTDGL